VYETSQVSTKWLLMTVHTHTNTHTHIEAHTHTLVDTTHKAAAHIQETHNKHENTYTHTQTQTHTQSSLTAENATATDCKTHTGHLFTTNSLYVNLGLARRAELSRLHGSIPAIPGRARNGR